MKKQTFFFPILALTLISCGSNNNAQYNNNYQTSNGYGDYSYPTNTTVPSTSRSTSVTQTKTSKQKVIDYLKAYGSYTDGQYVVSQTASSGSTKIADHIAYDVREDKFISDVLMITNASGGSVENFAMVKYSWGQFKQGSFLGMTAYTLSSGKSYSNMFSYVVSFSGCPTFQVTQYRVLQSQYSDSVSTDASLVADCLTRAINRLINQLPIMGSSESLW